MGNSICTFPNANKEAKRKNAMSNTVLAHVLIRVLKVTGISLLAFSKSARFGGLFLF